MAVAQAISTNEYGFSGRVRWCKILNPMRPPIATRDSLGMASTCPMKPAVQQESNGAFCKKAGELRARRKKSIRALETLILANQSPAAVKQFTTKASNILTPSVNFVSVGFTAFNGVEKTIAYLLGRQKVSGSKVEWVPYSKPGKVLFESWRSADTMSYQVFFENPSNPCIRTMFVRFQTCSHKILEIQVVEPGVIQGIALQFYYSGNLKDSYTQYKDSPAKICQQIQKACGAQSPYKGTSDCVSFMQQLNAKNQVMCNNFKKTSLSNRALFGNTSACRYTYALMAMANRGYCPYVGKIPRGNCAAKMCPTGYYANMFKQEGKSRYWYSPWFSCDSKTGECVEEWPNGISL